MVYKKTGFTISELLIAFALITISVLALLALGVSTFKASQKESDRPVGLQAAETVLNKFLYEAKDAGAGSDLWTAGAPPSTWKTGKLDMNATTFIYSLYATDVADQVAGGLFIPANGSPPGNRLKKVDVVVWWWDGQTGQRSGYGQLRVMKSRLVNENDM